MGSEPSFQAQSKSIGTGFPGVGIICACPLGAAAVGNLTVEVLIGQAVRAGPRYADMNASLVAQFSSTVQAMAYQDSGWVSDGLLDAMVATAFWIWAFSPLQNLTTIVFGSV